MRPALVLSVLLATVAAFGPSAEAGIGPIEVVPAALHAGDVLRYESVVEVESEGDESTRVEAPAGTVLVRVEGPARASDRFGVERSTVAFLVEALDANGSIVSAERCHAIAGGVEAVRRNLLVGNVPVGSVGVAPGAVLSAFVSPTIVEREDAAVADFSQDPCAGASTVAGRVLREGESVEAEDLGWSSSGAPLSSSPARATRFHGRPALEYDLALDEAVAGVRFLGNATIVLADGLPGVASVAFEGRVVGDLALPFASGTWSSDCEILISIRCSGESNMLPLVVPLDVRLASRAALVGFAPGDGAAVPPFDGTRLPGVAPARAFDGRALDDAALALPFSYGEAVNALARDPSALYSDWIAGHVDAHLVLALYDREATPQPSVATDGAWLLLYRDGAAYYCATVARVAEPASVGGILRVPREARVATKAQDCGMEVIVLLPVLGERAPDALAPASAIVAAASGEGLGEIRSFTFAVTPDGSASFLASEVSPSEGGKGASLALDATTGALVASESTRVSRETFTLIDPFSARSGVAAAGSPLQTAQTILAPAPGAGLAGGALVALALLLALATKFVFLPFFTRLRHDRLLDDPTRALLHEIVRAEPGIHLAALVERSGASEGATRHHLAHLVNARLLVEERSPGFTRYFVAGHLSPEESRRASLLRSASTARVHDVLSREPGLSLREVAARVGRSAPAVYRDVKRLRDAGLVPPRGRA